MRKGCPLGALLVLLLTACMPLSAPSPDAVSYSAWGDIVMLGDAPQREAPALHVTTDAVWAGWIAPQSRLNQHFFRRFERGRVSVVQSPQMPTQFPRDAQLYPAGGRDTLHQLWLATDERGTVQLYVATLAADLSLFRGPLMVSSNGALCYDTLPDGNGGLWALWRGGNPPHMQLYTAYIDPSGLVLQVNALDVAADGCPRLVAFPENTYAMWESAGRLQLAELIGGRLTPPQPVTEMPMLSADDRLRTFTAGGDSRWLYAFWNITRADGRNETYFTAGHPSRVAWPSPQPLNILADTITTFDTTLNTGTTFSAVTATEGRRASWASPAPDVLPLLPVALTLEDTALGVAYFADGDLRGYQQVTTVAPLLGVPSLRVDTNRHVYLAWSAPTLVGDSRLSITATRPITD
jgi:hypothetical protein